ncbi:MAG: hypothetical protein WB761_11095 [Solirubrobacteraceae bacterium]
MADDQLSVIGWRRPVRALGDLSVSPAYTDGEPAHEELTVAWVRARDFLDTGGPLLPRCHGHRAHLAIVTSRSRVRFTRFGG